MKHMKAMLLGAALMAGTTTLAVAQSVVPVQWGWGQRDNDDRHPGQLRLRKRHCRLIHCDRIGLGFHHQLAKLDGLHGAQRHCQLRSVTVSGQ